MRFLALALSISSLVGVSETALATEIVVLVNGGRMDVKTYEVQKHMVVVTTWDGKVQSFPRTWVDLEATKRLGHIDPTEGIAPERLEKARALLEAYGVRAAVSGYFPQLENEIRSIQTLIPRRTYDLVRASFRSGFDGERIFDVVAADFAKNIDDALLERWARWLSRPETGRIVAMENAAASDSDDIEESRYLSELYAEGSNVPRTDLIAQLDRAVHASETGLEVVVLLTDALQQSSRFVLADPPDEQSLDALRDRFGSSVRKATIDSLLYTYRAATYDELSQYLGFWETPEGSRIAGLIMSAIVGGARYGNEVAVRNVAAGMGVSETR